MSDEAKKTLFCPLTHMSCDQKLCAWWAIRGVVGTVYIYDCAIKVLAEKDNE